MIKQAAIGASVAVILAACAVTSEQARAADCSAGKAGDELSFEEANTVYQCIAQSLHDGYKKGNKRWVNADHVNDYRDWVQASTAPAAPGFHNSRFLMTWVNETGASEYLKYAENPTMPAGSVLVKESFSVTAKGKVRKGPLFIMEKAPAGASPQTDDWYYTMVSAKGVPQAVNTVTACSVCHQGNFQAQGGMGYPVEDVRVK